MKFDRLLGLFSSLIFLQNAGFLETCLIWASRYVSLMNLFMMFSAHFSLNNSGQWEDQLPGTSTRGTRGATQLSSSPFLSKQSRLPLEFFLPSEESPALHIQLLRRALSLCVFLSSPTSLLGKPFFITDPSKSRLTSAEIIFQLVVVCPPGLCCGYSTSGRRWSLCPVGCPAVLIDRLNGIFLLLSKCNRKIERDEGFPV